MKEYTNINGTKNDLLNSSIRLLGGTEGEPYDEAYYIEIYAYSNRPTKVKVTGKFSEDINQSPQLEEGEKIIMISDTMICQINNYTKIYLNTDDIFFGYHFDDAIRFPAALALIDSIGLYDNLNKRIGIYKIDVLPST